MSVEQVFSRLPAAQSSLSYITAIKTNYNICHKQCPMGDRDGAKSSALSYNRYIIAGENEGVRHFRKKHASDV